MGVAGAGRVRNQLGIWNKHLLRESDNDKTLVKYSPHCKMLNVGIAPTIFAKVFLQAGQNTITKSLSVIGFFDWDRVLRSDLNLYDRYNISSHTEDPWTTGPRRLSFSSSRLSLLCVHPWYLLSSNLSPIFAAESVPRRVPNFPLR